MPPNNFTSLPKNELGTFNAGGPTPTFNPPQTPATANYRLNHLAIRIKDPARSLHFYVDLLGMRVVFSFNAGPFTIYYLGHPPADEDLDAWAKKTSEIPVMTRTSGLLELYHIHGTESKTGDSTDTGTGTGTGNDSGSGAEVSTGNEPPNLGFAHLGFTVPDVPAAVGRLRDAGVAILKDVGVCERESIPLSEWEAERDIGVGQIHPNYAWFFEKFAMVADPDGYSLELIPQNI